MGKIREICKRVSNNTYRYHIGELLIHLREESTPGQRFSEKEIWNLDPSTTAYICKSISDIPGISELL